MVEARMLKSEQTRMSEDVQVVNTCKAEACQNDTKGLLHDNAVLF